MNKMYLVLGDWSDDGHGKTDKVLIETNKTLEEIQNAYKASCKLTGISFNGDNDYTDNGRNWQSAKRFRVAVEYEESKLFPDVLDVLEEYNCPKEIIDNYNEEAWTVNYINLWFWFVGISLPSDFEWSITEEKDAIPCINGYWSKNLNASFGYGLYN